MTLYLSFRSQSVGGGVVDPRIFEGSGNAATPALTLVAPETIASRIAGKNVLFAAHGFNVSLENGARSLGRLEPLLNLGTSDLFFGVLWPGDFWLPVINYPFEGSDAIECGKRLARFCKARLKRAASFSFISHSLGARLVLEAVKQLDRPARAVCLAAAAIDRDCLTREYAAAFANASRISILASHSDRVLQLAFPAGDLFGGLWRDDNDVFRAALGYDGPLAAIGATQPPWQINDDADYGHGDYLPPSDPTAPAPGGKWNSPAEFMRRTYRGQPPTWPT